MAKRGKTPACSNFHQNGLVIAVDSRKVLGTVNPSEPSPMAWRARSSEWCFPSVLAESCMMRQPFASRTAWEKCQLMMPAMRRRHFQCRMACWDSHPLLRPKIHVDRVLPVLSSTLVPLLLLVPVVGTAESAMSLSGIEERRASDWSCDPVSDPSSWRRSSCRT